MKIDLHCHTKSIKKGDGSGRNVSLALFQQKVMDADVKIVAITNHNSFDLEQFEKFQKGVKDFCQVWPGVEIDILQSGSHRWHLIVVANPDNVEQFAKRCDLLFQGKDLETCTVTIQEVYHSLNNCDVIYISHFHKKPAIPDEDREELLSIVGDRSRVFNETADNRSLGVYANYDYNVLIGSDVKDWSVYEQSTFADLRLPVSSFQQFCLLAKRDSVVINTLLNAKKSYNMMASPHKSVHFPLRIYEDINIIFGQKGTGKSEILNSLYAQMLSQGLSCVKYAGAEKDESFKSLLDVKDMEPDLSKVEADSCEAEFSKILSWVDSGPVQFKRYLDWYSTKDNNANKRRMKITESTELVDPKPENYDVHNKDKKDIKTIVHAAQDIKLTSYLEEKEAKCLRELLDKLSEKSYHIYMADLIQIEAAKLVNYSLTKIKAVADKNSNTISRPPATGFREFAEHRIELRKSIDTILENLNAEEHNEQEDLGMLEEKGRICINKKYRMLCGSSKTAEFPLCGIRLLKDIWDLLAKIRDNIFSNDISTLLSDLSKKCAEGSISSLKPFLGLSKQIILQDGTEYLPSNGEKGILLLQQKLNSEADAYFLDEPELGMGNSYIDTNIRPIICALAKQNKVVVVATHNANIAVRTLPYMSIFRTHQNGKYNTYIGNPFNDLLENIFDSSDVKNWSIESLHTLEGGKDAFYERKNIYESQSN